MRFLLGGPVFLAGRLGLRYHWGCMFLVLDWSDGRFRHILSYGMVKCTFSYSFSCSGLLYIGYSSIRFIATDLGPVNPYCSVSFCSPYLPHSPSTATANYFLVVWCLTGGSVVSINRMGLSWLFVGVGVGVRLCTDRNLFVVVYRPFLFPNHLIVCWL
jgi:hypothetical protein